MASRVISHQPAAESDPPLTDVLLLGDRGFRMLFNRINDGLFLWPHVPVETRPRFTEVNPAACRLLGYEREELLRLPIDAIASSETWAQAPARYNQLVRDGEVLFEATLRHRDGTLIPIELHASRFATGAQPLILGIAHNLTDRRRLEALQRFSEDKFAVAFQSCPDAIVITRLDDGRILEINEAATRLSGYTRAETLGRTTADLGLWAAPAQRQQVIEHLAAEGQVRNIEAHFRIRDGAMRTGLVSGRRIEIDGVPHALTLIRDVTDQRRLREEINNFFNLSPDLHCIAGLDGYFKHVNPSFTRLLGYSFHELLSRPFVDFVHPDDRPATVAELAKLAAGALTIQFENRYRHRDGRYRCLAWSARPTENGLVYAVARDVTALKEIEHRLERLGLVAARTSNSVIITDAEGHIEWVNEGFTRICGYTAEEVLGLKPGAFLQGAATDPETVAHLRTQIALGAPFAVEIVNYRKDGTAYWIDLQGEPIHDADGTLSGFFAIAQDISERKETEALKAQFLTELEARNTEMERFNYTISHDLKSPLFTMQGFVNLVQGDLARGDIDAAQQDLRRIATAAHTMQALVDNLLALSRAGQTARCDEQVNLTEIAHHAIDQLAGVILLRGVSITLAGNLPTVRGDRIRLFEVFLNLTQNAIKFMGDQPQPRVTVGGQQKDGQVVCFVRDNGIGIAPEDQDCVFDLFQRLDRQAEGSGIGLALVKRIIEVHGGTIWLESEGPGHGTTVSFSLPLAD